MTKKTALATFIQLKLFPRWKNGMIDHGRHIGLVSGEIKCCKCKEQMTLTISLEYCASCGWVAFDYWGDYKAGTMCINTDDK